MITNDKTNKEAPGLMFFIFGIVLGVGLSLVFEVEDPSLGHAVGIALFGSSLSFFLEFCFRPGAIFSFWTRFIEKNFRDNPKNPFGFLFNPLGGCIYCMNIWITLFIFVAFAFFLATPLLFLLPSLLVSHLVLNVFDRLFWGP